MSIGDGSHSYNKVVFFKLYGEVRDMGGVGGRVFDEKSDLHGHACFGCGQDFNRGGFGSEVGIQGKG